MYEFDRYLFLEFFEKDVKLKVFYRKLFLSSYLTNLFFPQTGGRRRDPHAIKMARRSVASSAKARSKSRRDDKRHRKTSLFRKLSSKKATAEMQMLSGSQSLNSLSPANPILRHSTSTPDPNHSDSSSPAGKE